MRTQVTAYTDGSCKGNPGPGGYAVILTFGDREKIIRGGVAETTNNRMELTAVIEAVKALRKPCELTIVTDSKYVMMTKEKWRKMQSRTHVPNWDLWQCLLDESKKGNHILHFQHIAGHSGHTYNERCDKIAKEQAVKYSHVAAGTNTLTIQEALAVLKERFADANERSK